MKTVHTQIKEMRLKETALSVTFKIVLIIYTIINFSSIYVIDKIGNKKIDYLQLLSVACSIVIIALVCKMRLFNRKVYNISAAVVSINTNEITINYRSFRNKDKEIRMNSDEINGATLTIDDCGINIVVERYSYISKDKKSITGTNVINFTIIDNFGILREIINALQDEVGLSNFKANSLRDRIT